MPEGDKPNGDPSTDKYRGKTTAEKYIADPIRTIGEKLDALTHQELGVAKERDEHDRRHDCAERARHQQTLNVHKVSAGISLVLSFLTLLVLIGTKGVYSRQAAIMNTQATIMATQAVIMDKQREMTELSTAPRVIISLERIDTNRFVVAARNIGHQTADNVRIFWDFKRNPPGEFVPPMMNPHPDPEWTSARLKSTHDRLIATDRERMKAEGMTLEQINKAMAAEIAQFRASEKQLDYYAFHPDGADIWIQEVPTIDAAPYVGFANIIRQGNPDRLWVFGHCRYDYGKPAIRTFDSPFCIALAPDGSISSCLSLETDIHID